ncbi:cyclin-dependent kinases regulatory subunit 1-like isoform X1 [Heptranchias perlo]|uniref:cyclin-dependent kinases regulatory subunit 1-like isoform X1 n=1 Tax=Heptranchias perlo TaxID=212740 RepID=UPI00355A954B
MDTSGLRFLKDITDEQHLKKEQNKGKREKPTHSHVMLPKKIAKLVPKTHLMSETEWRNLGVQQSPGWIHYMIHEPEPHILLFRRPLPKKELEGI